MTVAVTVEAEGAELVIAGLEERLGDLSVPFQKIGESVLEDARAEIVSQGRAFGSDWAEMSPLTPIVAVKLYAKGRDPRTLLNDTHGLLDSLTPGDPTNLFEVEPLGAEFGSSYTSPRTGWGIGRVQQEGSTRTFHVLQGSGFSVPGIPPRPFLEFRAERVPLYEELIAQHVRGEL